MKTLTIKVPDALFAEIAQAADARKVSKAVIVRERLGQREAEEGGTSLWERMEDLVISEDSLPADLAANKAHLQGYGQYGAD